MTTVAQLHAEIANHRRYYPSNALGTAQEADAVTALRGQGEQFGQEVRTADPGLLYAGGAAHRPGDRSAVHRHQPAVAGPDRPMLARGARAEMVDVVEVYGSDQEPGPFSNSQSALDPGPGLPGRTEVHRDPTEFQPPVVAGRTADNILVGSHPGITRFRICTGEKVFFLVHPWTLPGSSMNRKNGETIPLVAAVTRVCLSFPTTSAKS